MRYRIAANRATDLLPRSDFQVLAPDEGGPPMVVPRSARARKVLRRRLLWLAGRTGAFYLAGMVLGMLAGWTATALWVLAR